MQLVRMLATFSNSCWQGILRPKKFDHFYYLYDSDTSFNIFSKRLRCTKSIKNSNESEYRVLLDNFMEDVITVLNFPEWPAAEIIVHIFSKIMVIFIIRCMGSYTLLFIDSFYHS